MKRIFTLLCIVSVASSHARVTEALSESFNIQLKSPEPEPELVEEVVAAPAVQVAVQEAIMTPAAPSIPTFISDLEVNIPQAESVKSNHFALIMANEDYLSSASVPYAANDGELFYKYCSETLGIPARQIKFVKNATLNQMINGIDWLSGVMETWDGEAKVLVYYAGHGVPDNKTKVAHIVPIDANPAKVEQLYSLDKLYASLGAIDSKSVTYFIDACFSGTVRNGDSLVEGGRSVVIKPKANVLEGNSVVFSAADGYQTAHPYEEKKHGIFTYFLLKSIKESKGDISYGELFDMVHINVKRETSLNSTEQTPTVNVSQSMVDVWRNFKL